jgi:hypothetical protein
MSTFFCSDMARSEGDQLFGTAKQVHIYIALEYWPAWSRKVIESELLPNEVREFVAKIRKETRESRFLLLRQPESKYRKPSCFIAMTRERDSAVYHCKLDDYRDILSLDIPALLAGAPDLPRWADPMFLVCNHAKHDKCCPKYGNPVLDAIQSEAPNQVWESSHLGGCRFAANLVCLPQGLVYGQLSPRDAISALSEYEDGNILLPKFRGRACFSKPVQAAEYFVRREAGICGIDRLRLLGSSRSGTDGWTTKFELAGSGTGFSVEHTASHSALPRLLACSDVEPEFVWSHHMSSMRRFAIPLTG